MPRFFFPEWQLGSTPGKGKSDPRKYLGNRVCILPHPSSRVLEMADFSQSAVNILCTCRNSTKATSDLSPLQLPLPRLCILADFLFQTSGPCYTSECIIQTSLPQRGRSWDKAECTFTPSITSSKLPGSMRGFL